MGLYKRREKFQDISIKIGLAFSKLKLSPNTWTMLTLIFILIGFYFLLFSQFFIAGLFLMISAFLDVVDGSVARITGKDSKLGAYLDTVIDRYVEFIVILGILFAGIPDFIVPSPAWIILFLFGALMTTYAKSAAKEKEIFETEISGGVMERAERFILLIIGFFLAALNPLYLTYIIALLAVLTNITAIQRIWIAIGRAKE
jgi:archaetidylinositol phosphate synthase